MYNLLIVDDEIPILNSYYKILKKHFEDELNIDKCPTSKDALNFANNRIDILVTDIFMPELNGYELQNKITDIWPNCRVIFLTGNSDVENVQKAIRSSNKITDYILKIDTDDSIIAAVKKAIVSLDNEIVKKDVMDEVQKNLHLALPILQKEFFLSLIKEPYSSITYVKQKLYQYQLNFNENIPLILLCCSVQKRDNSFYNEPSNFDTVHFAIDDILNKYLSHNFVSYSIVYDKNKIVWFLQPKNDFIKIKKDTHELTYYVYSFLDIIQDNCKRLIKTTLNFAMSRNTTNWNEIYSSFSKLLTIVEQNNLFSESIIFIEDISDDDLLFHNKNNNDIDLILNDIDNALLNNNKEKLINNIKKIVFFMTKDRETFILLRFEISSIFINFMKKINLHKITYNEICSKLIDMSDNSLEYDKLLKNYLEIIDSLAEHIHNKSSNSDVIIDRTLKYIEENISDDLSLTKVSSVIYHSPTYLSKLFKRQMGIGFCNYVNNERMKIAKDLVINTDKKISDIATEVGFDSVSYFIKVFKKTYSLPPQEYRDKYCA